MLRRWSRVNKFRADQGAANVIRWRCDCSLVITATHGQRWLCPQGWHAAAELIRTTSPTVVTVLVPAAPRASCSSAALKTYSASKVPLKQQLQLLARTGHKQQSPQAILNLVNILVLHRSREVLMNILDVRRSKLLICRMRMLPGTTCSWDCICCSCENAKALEDCAS